MIVSRIVSLGLRLAQFVFAAIVLGLSAYFLYQHNHDEGYNGPFGRIIYTLIVAVLAVLAALFGMIPTKSSIASYGSDLFFTAAWFAAFGVLVQFYHSINCGSIWYWRGIGFRGQGRGNQCGRWNALQAFSFLSAICWFVSFVLGVIVHHKLKRDAAVVDGRSRRRWGRSRV